jgi:hypothetical protein
LTKPSKPKASESLGYLGPVIGYFRALVLFAFPARKAARKKMTNRNNGAEAPKGEEKRKRKRMYKPYLIALSVHKMTKKRVESGTA